MATVYTVICIIACSQPTRTPSKTNTYKDYYTAYLSLLLANRYTDRTAERVVDPDIKLCRLHAVLPYLNYLLLDEKLMSKHAIL